jgi:hypothetical protein
MSWTGLLKPSARRFTLSRHAHSGRMPPQRKLEAFDFSFPTLRLIS